MEAVLSAGNREDMVLVAYMTRYSKVAGKNTIHGNLAAVSLRSPICTRVLEAARCTGCSKDGWDFLTLRLEKAHFWSIPFCSSQLHTFCFGRSLIQSDRRGDLLLESRRNT